MAFLPVLLAGGSGVRLWPLSAPDIPKQFLPLVGGRSLLQETVVRLAGTDAADPLVVCGARHRHLADAQLRAIGCDRATLLLEPAGRNTAPAAALAALLALATQPDAVLLILPCDHLIADVARFHAAVVIAAALAEEGRIVAFGVVPDRAETGYGYIGRGAPIAGGQAFAIDGFVEKPDAETARRLAGEGGHDWNGGMFMVRADLYVEELGRHRPDILDACRSAIGPAACGAPVVEVDAAAFSACASVPIDRAIMERTDRGAVVPLDAGWHDVGSWPSLWRALPRDGDGNAIAGDAVAMASRGNLVDAGGRRVVLLGVDDLVVVETADAILVARRDAAGCADRLAALSASRDGGA